MSKNNLTIGRNPNNDWILNDKSVEDFHAEIKALDNSIQIIDLQSKMGIIVNGRKVIEHQLLPGDVVQIGFQQLDWESKTTSLINQNGIETESQEQTTSKNKKTEIENDLNRFLREIASTSPQEDEEISIANVIHKNAKTVSPITHTKEVLEVPVLEKINKIDYGNSKVETLLHQTSTKIKPTSQPPNNKSSEIRVVKGTSMETSVMPISNKYFYFKSIATAISIALIAILMGYYLSSVLNY